MEEQRKQGIILVGVGVDCVSIVEQAVHELKETTEIKGIAFDRADRYEELMDRSYPQLDVEKIPTVDFDKLLVCCKNCIMKECVELFCEEFNLSRTKCGSYITPKIGPRKIDWDRVKCKDDIAEQIRCSGTMNDLERFFYTKQHREIYKWIHYFEIYDRHFAKYRGKAPLVMEIGVFHGGSVQMWKDYFGKEATIIGVDIDPSTKIFEEDQIHIEIGSQSDREFLRQLKQKYPRIDVLIDDGGHTMEQQITTLEEMFGHLSDDGVYLCEDLHTSYWKERGVGTNVQILL